MLKGVYQNKGSIAGTTLLLYYFIYSGSKAVGNRLYIYCFNRVKVVTKGVKVVINNN